MLSELAWKLEMYFSIAAVIEAGLRPKLKNLGIADWRPIRRTVIGMPKAPD